MTTLEEIDKYLPKSKIVSVTEVGSQMWQMSDLSSDHDMVIIYQEDTRDILSGRGISNTLPCKHHVMINDQEYDFSYLEIGHFCNNLKKGNINMIWALLSPIVVYQDMFIVSLQREIEKCHTADIVPSGVGMVTSQMRDVVKRADVRPPEKSLKTAYRTARFVLNHLVTGEWKFNPILKDVTEEDVNDMIDNIRTIETNGDFGHMPKNYIESWLLHTRMCNLSNKNI